MEFFGDSYDVVKRYLLQTLAPDASWQAFPMFTHDVREWMVVELEAFLGVRINGYDVLTPKTDRASHLRVDPESAHVFLDPDTGVRLKPCGGATSTRYVFGPELIGICQQRSDRMVLVFDQSLVRGRERESLVAKLDYFHEHGVSGFAYMSHACFLVLSATESVLETATDRLADSRLPATRLVWGPCA